MGYVPPPFPVEPRTKEVLDVSGVLQLLKDWWDQDFEAKTGKLPPFSRLITGSWYKDIKDTETGVCVARFCNGKTRSLLCDACRLEHPSRNKPEAPLNRRVYPG